SFPTRRSSDLVISGQADGNTGDFLKFIDATPVKRMTGGFTESMSAVGKGKLHLKLELPIGNLAATKLAGEYQFANNSLTLHPQLPPVERASGKVSFTESTLTVRDGRTRISVESPLRGISSALPAPLAKSAPDALPLRIEVVPADGGARDRISLTLGRLAAAEFDLRRQGEAMVVQKAAIWLTPS